MRDPTAVHGGAPAFLHPTLDGGGGDGVAPAEGGPRRTASDALWKPEDAQLTDQQRLGVVLQAAALLGHCEHAGLRVGCLPGSLTDSDPHAEVVDPWADARVDSDGRLLGLRVRPGRDGRLPQSLLLALIHRLFRTAGDSVSGRGAARRVARELIELWSQELEPQPPDQAVGQILDSAPFLWGEGFAAARECLAAAGPRSGVWLVAPGQVRRRFLKRVAAEGHAEEVQTGEGRAEEGRTEDARAALAGLLRSPQARDLWDGVDSTSDPTALAARGAFRRAAAAWSRRKKLERGERLDYARCLAHLGRFGGAVDVARDVVRQDPECDEPEAALCLARAQLDLGERRAADRTLRPVRQRFGGLNGPEELGADAYLDWAEIEIRLAAARGATDDRSRSGISWTDRLVALAKERALERTREPGDGGLEIQPHHRNLAWILVAGAAYDRFDDEAMIGYLERSADAVFAGAYDAAQEVTAQEIAIQDIAARWLHAEGLRRLHVGDGPGAAEHVAAALARNRRRLPPARAGRLWNDLAVARALADDLPAAERACRHALRLLSRTEGPARLTLALYNLAEVRLRRGSWKGVAGTLERSAAENRRSGNQRGLILDLELWTRVELAQGRAAAALARCAEARKLIESGAPGRADVFRLLAARAYGWLGRQGDAAMALDGIRSEALLELEPEERAPVLALAGRLEDAAAEAHSTAWEPLWTALAAGDHPTLEAWSALDLLEPYRAARLVLDVETVLPGVTPALPLRRAVHAFRSLGVEAFAETLEQRSTSPWLALREYLGEPRTDLEPAARLLRTAGYGEARVQWQGTDRDEPEVLVAGRGGEQRLDAAAGAGDLILQAPQIDGVLEALFALLRDDLERVLKLGPLGTLGKELDGEGGGKDDEDLRDPGLRDGIVGRSAELRKVLHRLDRLADGDLPLLVLGESGTGKELAARRVHRKSRRHAAPFLPINCAALSETLIQSDLFGHVRGSFTGADKDRAGVFEAARGGTVFLDEIGDLPMSSQGKLLRVLQEGEIRRVGESFARKVDVRVVTATHRDLAQMVEDATFRQDLYYRLRVAKVELPPLRERGDDLVRIAEYLLRRIPAGPQQLTAAAVARLRAYSWPGNIREMRNILEVASALSDADEVSPESLDLPEETATAGGETSTAEHPGDGAIIDYHHQVELLRRRLVSEALEWSDGNRAEAARRLGMSRQALSYLVKQLGLS